ncbi:hypothetical protein [Streptomyces sp. NPDC056938]|uniref:hypothetical protein n=1 Tax=unclassified Streptomyces TaxID=2593676 RepID=UPI003640B5D0
MSDLGDAAAAHARRQEQAAEAAAINRAQRQRAHEARAALLRERAREFFDYARDHAAPLFPLYLLGSLQHDGAYARIDEPCITAAAAGHDLFTGRHPVGRWTVTSDGSVYCSARIEQRQRVRDARRYGIREDVFVVVDMSRHDLWEPHYGELRPHFEAAASALHKAARLAGSWDLMTGIQSDGLIGYVL